jgi:hypothetical protein
MKTTSHGRACLAALSSVAAGLLHVGQQVFLARDAVGSRRAET